MFPLEFNPLATLVANLLFGVPFVYLMYVYWWRPSRRPRETSGSQRSPK